MGNFSEQRASVFVLVLVLVSVLVLVLGQRRAGGDQRRTGGANR